MGWFKTAVMVWFGFALIRLLAGTFIDPKWSSSNNVFDLLKGTWGFTMILKPITGTLYQCAVVTMTLAFILHCGQLVAKRLQDIVIMGLCTAAAPFVIPIIVYGRVTLNQYLTGLDESFGFALIIALFYALGDFLQTLTVQQKDDRINTARSGAPAPASTHGTGTATRNRTTTSGAGAGDALRTGPSRSGQEANQVQADKLREFTCVTFVIILPLVVMWEYYAERNNTSTARLIKSI